MTDTAVSVCNVGVTVAVFELTSVCVGQWGFLIKDQTDGRELSSVHQYTLLNS